MEVDYAVGTAFLGLANAGPDSVRYFYYGEDADVTPPCATDGAVGCFVAPSDIISGNWFHRHEAVHAYANALGSPPRFFREGLAEVIGPTTGDGYVRVTHDADVVKMIEGEIELDYATSASFTRFLIDEFGRDAFLDFYIAAGDDPQAAHFEEAFESAFGRPLAEAASTWGELPVEYRGDAYFWLAECAADPVTAPLGAGPVYLDQELTCANVPLDSNRVPGQLGSFQAIAVGESAALHLTIQSDVMAGASVAGCSTYLEGEPGVALGADGDLRSVELWAEVGAGEYFISTWELGVEAPSGTTQVYVETVAPPLSESCEGAGAVPLDGGTSVVRLDGVARSGQLFVWLEPEVSGEIELGTASFALGSGLADAAAVRAAVCTGSCQALSCDDSFWTDASSWSPPKFTVVGGTQYLLEVEFAPGSHVRMDLARDG